METYTPKDIGIFIDSGWRTIPYESITYDQDGKKIAYPPIKWKQYQTTINKERSSAGAVICDNVLVIDCDSLEATQRFLNIAQIPNLSTIESLSQEGAEEHIGLIVKTRRGYHFYFRNDGTFKDCKDDQIDIQATNKKIVYLPSEASEGKEITAINRLYSRDGVTIQLHKVPNTIREWIESISQDDSPEAIKAKKEIRYLVGTPLAKIPKGSPLFYKRLTPKKHRTIATYRQIIDKKGYLHPNDIKQGDGNEYLTSIAGILSADITIDINDFWDILHFINSQWDEPLSSEALTKKLEGYALSNYPDCPFIYDEHWENMQYSFIDIDGNDIMMVFDLKSSKYIIANLSTNELYTKNSQDALAFYANRTGTALKATQLATQVCGVNLTFKPTQPFGLSSDKTFNTYKPSKYLDILTASDNSYSEAEIQDAHTCKAIPFFKHLFKEQYIYFLKFLKTKLTTFHYSPTIFCLFDDEGGAGKGALEVLLGHFVGNEKVTKIPFSTFQSKFTSDFEGKLFLFCNEYPDDFKTRRLTTDKLKEISGSPTIKIERKGVDPYEIANFNTLFVTSNRISVEIKEGDRRFCVVQCDKKFDHSFPQGYFDEMISDAELTKLALYIRYLTQPLNHNEYMSPPNTTAKDLFVDCVGSDSELIVRAMCDGEWETLIALSAEILKPKDDLVNLTKLSSILNIQTRYLTQLIRRKVGQGKLDMRVFQDTNKKFDMQHYTYGELPRGTLKRFLTNTQAKKVASVKI